MKENLDTCSNQSDTRQKWRKNLVSAIIFLALVALTFYAIAKGNDMEAVYRAIRQMDGIYMVAAMLLGIFFVSAEGCMIWYLLRALGSKTGVMKCIKYSFIGFFFSGITPSATGGQPMQLYHMKKDGLHVSESTVVLMTVAVVYKFVLVVIGLFILAVAYGPLSFFLGHYIWLYYLGVFLNTLLVVILLMVMFLPGLFKTMVFKVEGFCVKLHILKHSMKRLDQLEGFVDKYHETVSFLLAHKVKIAVVVGFTVIQRCSVFLLTYLVYLGFHLSGDSVWTVMMLQASVYIAVDMLPLPGAQGITELMYKSVFAGVFSGSLLTASMCVSRGINFYFLLICAALVSLVSHFTRRRVQQ